MHKYRSTSVGEETIANCPASQRPDLHLARHPRVTDALREGDVTDALCKVNAAAGQQLAEPLLREAGDVNELDDVLVVLD